MLVAQLRRDYLLGRPLRLLLLPLEGRSVAAAAAAMMVLVVAGIVVVRRRRTTAGRVEGIAPRWVC